MVTLDFMWTLCFILCFCAEGKNMYSNGPLYQPQYHEQRDASQKLTMEQSERQRQYPTESSQGYSVPFNPDALKSSPQQQNLQEGVAAQRQGDEQFRYMPAAAGPNYPLYTSFPQYTSYPTPTPSTFFRWKNALQNGLGSLAAAAATAVSNNLQAISNPPYRDGGQRGSGTVPPMGLSHMYPPSSVYASGYPTGAGDVPIHTHPSNGNAFVEPDTPEYPHQASLHSDVAGATPGQYIPRNPSPATNLQRPKETVMHNQQPDNGMLQHLYTNVKQWVSGGASSMPDKYFPSQHLSNFESSATGIPLSGESSARGSEGSGLGFSSQSELLQSRDQEKDTFAADTTATDDLQVEDFDSPQIVVIPAATTTFSTPYKRKSNPTVVLINNPREFYRKKKLFVNGGPKAMQIFSNFEDVFTKHTSRSTHGPAEEATAGITGTEIGVDPSSSGRSGRFSLNTAQYLHTSKVLSPQAVSQLHGITSEFLHGYKVPPVPDAASIAEPVGEQSPDGYDAAGMFVGVKKNVNDVHTADGERYCPTDEQWEQYILRCQKVITQTGRLHSSYVGPLVRDMLAAGGMNSQPSGIQLRPGVCELLDTITKSYIPTYVFSSGYGDLVSEALSQTCLRGTTQGGSSSSLPINLRVISNFFRVGADGTVRGFSSPIVHERNKNAVTAGAVMGMELPNNRPNSLVLGGRMEDVTLSCPSSYVGATEGEDPQDAAEVSIGFLPLDKDFANQLPAYLRSYDAVVLGEGSMDFVSQFLGDVTLQSVPRTAGIPFGLSFPNTSAYLSKGSSFLSMLGSPSLSSMYPQPAQPPWQTDGRVPMHSENRMSGGDYRKSQEGGQVPVTGELYNPRPSPAAAASGTYPDPANPTSPYLY